MSSLTYNLRARRINTAAMSAHMCQSRNSLASANVERATASRSPMPYNFEGCAPRHASMSRRLSRYVICANAIMRNCSPQRRLRTRTSPPYRVTIRSKLVHGTKSITCENIVLPTFTVRPPIVKIGHPTANSRTQVQIDTKQNLLQLVATQRLFSAPLALNRTGMTQDPIGTFDDFNVEMRQNLCKRS